MIKNNYTNFIMTALTLALFLNGLNPWINPSQAVAVEISATEGKNTSCSTENKVSTQTLEGVNNVERLLGYIESSVNDIQLTISGIDRKLRELPTRSQSERN